MACALTCGRLAVFLGCLHAAKGTAKPAKCSTLVVKPPALVITLLLSSSPLVGLSLSCGLALNAGFNLFIASRGVRSS